MRPYPKYSLQKMSGICALIIFFCCYLTPEAFAQDKSTIPPRIKKLQNLKTYSADVKPTGKIDFKKAATYGDNESVFLGARITDVEVDRKGRVYMLDFGQQKVQVFNADGSFLKRVGRRGRGPGEFQRAVKIAIHKNNLFVLDHAQHKISQFDTRTLAHIRDLNIAFNSQSKPSWLTQVQKKKLFYKANDIIARQDGSLYIIYSDDTVGPAKNLSGRTYEFSTYDPEKASFTHHDVLSFKWTGGVLKTEGRGGTISVMYNVPYKNRSQFDYGKNQLVYGWTDDFLFKFYDKDGQYTHAFYYPFKHINLNQDDVFSFYNHNKGVIKNINKDNLPKTWPAFYSVIMDDNNRLWVSTFTKNPEKRKWLVMNSSGKLLATFKWPKENKLKAVKNGHAFVLKRNPKTGTLAVENYQFILN